MIDRVRVQITSLVIISLIAGLIAACGGSGEDSAMAPTVIVEVAGSPTVRPFLIPDTPTPIPDIPPVDPGVLEILGAGPRKAFPSELLPDSPELPQDEVIRLWTEFFTNVYSIQGPELIFYYCEGGVHGQAVNRDDPRWTTYGANWEIVEGTEIPRMEWNHARMFVRGQTGDFHIERLSPPKEDGRFGYTADPESGFTQNPSVHDKRDCPPAGDPNAEPTPLPTLLESEPQDERVLPEALLATGMSIGDQVALWTEYFSNAHMIPTDITRAAKSERSPPSRTPMIGYLVLKHQLGGTYDLLLCGDGRYHWMGSASVNIVNYSEPGWRGGQDGDWKVSAEGGAPRLQLFPDDPRVIASGFDFPLLIEEGQLASSLVIQRRTNPDLIFTLYEASGCP